MIEKRIIFAALLFFAISLGCFTVIASTALWYLSGYPWADADSIYLWRVPEHKQYILDPIYTYCIIAVPALSLFTPLTLVLLSMRKANSSYGNASWQTPPEIKKNGNAGKLGGELILGKITNPSTNSRDYITTSKQQPHIMMVAPTGSGKGVGFVIPNLLLHVGSAIVLDVKGELWEKTSRARQSQGNIVYRFDPFQEEGISHRFNPLEEIAQSKNRRIMYTELERMAQYFIATTDGQLEGWLGSARRLFIAACILCIEKKKPTIGEVLRTLQTGESHHKALLRLSEEVDHPSARKIFEEFAGYDDTQWSNYTSVLFGAGGLGLWSNESVDLATSKSDFSFTDFRSRKQTMYICLDRNDLKAMAPLVRLLFGRMMATMMRQEPDPVTEPFPVMLMIDEFTQLGKMSVVSESIDVIRSFGGRMMLIAQNLPRLDTIYTQDGRDALLAGAGAQLYLTPNELKTADHIRRTVGQYTRKRTSRTRKSDFDIVTVNQSSTVSHDAADLLKLDDVSTFPDDKVIIKMRGQQPIKAFRNIYFKDIFLSGLFDSQKGKLPNPSPMFDLSEKSDSNEANLLNDVLDAFFDENSVDEALSVVKVTELKPLDEQRKPSEEGILSAANSLAEFDAGLDEFSEYRDI